MAKNLCLVRFIPLTQGQTALVDEEDYEELAQFNWCTLRLPHANYAMRRLSRSEGHHCIYMHRIVMSAADGVQVDHINHNGLDNRRKNLRVATAGENRRNSRIRSDNASGYKGVTWDRSREKWIAGIRSGGHRINLGRFDTAEEAAAAYDQAALDLHGDFALTNGMLSGT